MKKYIIDYILKDRDTLAPLQFIVNADSKEQALERFSDRPIAFNEIGQTVVQSIKEYDGKENA